jgi:predicted amidohydrolase
MKIGFLQFRPFLLEPDKNTAKVTEMIEAENKNFDLLVLPELSNSGYLFSSADEAAASSEEIPNGSFCKALLQIAAKKNVFICSGINERAGDKLYNSAILVHPNGKIDTYRKTHLFYDEKKWFASGDTGLNVFNIEGSFGKVKIGIMICFDWIFPESARTLALKGAQVICHPSNLVLAYCQKAMFTRAIENRIFTITANRIGTESSGDKKLFFTGESVMVDPKGNYLARAAIDEECIIIADINPADAKDKNVTELNNIFEDRRTDMYSR